MNDLVFNGENGQALTNSLLVAEKFGKDHRHVLTSIRELIKGCAEKSADLMFAEATYKNPQNEQEYPMFIMTRDGFTPLAMGFTGKKALQFKLDFINAFNAMERQFRQPTDMNVLDEIERRLTLESKKWFEYMGKLQEGAKGKMNLVPCVKLSPDIDRSMTQEQRIDSLVYFVSNNINGALYAHSRAIEAEREVNRSLDDRVDDMYADFENPKGLPKAYLREALDSAIDFIKDEYYPDRPVKDPLARMVRRIKAAKVLFVEKGEEVAL